MVGLRSDGTVIAAGDNIHGQCEVSDWEDITAIACGMWHTVGLKADGTVVAVGDSTKGACNVNGWSRIRRIACGDCTTLGLDMDGNILTAGKPKCDGQFVLTEREKDFLPYTDIRKI